MERPASAGRSLFYRDIQFQRITTIVAHDCTFPYIPHLNGQDFGQSRVRGRLGFHAKAIQEQRGFDWKHRLLGSIGFI